MARPLQGWGRKGNYWPGVVYLRKKNYVWGEPWSCRSLKDQGLWRVRPPGITEGEEQALEKDAKNNPEKCK